MVCTYLEYAILELKLSSTAVVLRRAFLRCCFAAAVALRLRSLSVRLIASVAASLKTSDGSLWTAFCHVVGPHPAPSLQRSPAPAHLPCLTSVYLLSTIKLTAYVHPVFSKICGEIT